LPTVGGRPVARVAEEAPAVRIVTACIRLRVRPAVRHESVWRGAKTTRLCDQESGGWAWVRGLDLVAGQLFRRIALFRTTAAVYRWRCVIVNGSRGVAHLIRENARRCRKPARQCGDACCAVDVDAAKSSRMGAGGRRGATPHHMNRLWPANGPRALETPYSGPSLQPIFCIMYPPAVTGDALALRATFRAGQTFLT
jgi:hypothetical protein